MVMLSFFIMMSRFLVLIRSSVVRECRVLVLFTTLVEMSNIYYVIGKTSGTLKILGSAIIVFLWYFR